jgi:hypothetical protein
MPERMQALDFNFNVASLEFGYDLLNHSHRGHVPEMGVVQPDDDPARIGPEVDLIVKKVRRSKENLSLNLVDIRTSSLIF